MVDIAKKSTTAKRHKKIFARYIELLRYEYKLDPKKAIRLPKSHFYDILADEFANASSYIGRVIQLSVQKMGTPPTKKDLSGSQAMDERVRFILGLDND